MTDPTPTPPRLPRRRTPPRPRRRPGPPSRVRERDIHSLIEALNAENTQMKDKVLRTLAEMENLRRRTEKEVADARAYATTNFARDMLTVADNVRRALESVPAEAAAAPPRAR